MKGFVLGCINEHSRILNSGKVPTSSFSALLTSEKKSANSGKIPAKFVQFGAKSIKISTKVFNVANFGIFKAIFKTKKMRSENGLLFSSPGLCFSPGWRCPEALFIVFRSNSKRRKGRRVPVPVRCTGSGFSHVSIGSGGLRAWLCAFVLGFDAFRDGLDRRNLRVNPHQRISSFESSLIVIVLPEQRRVH